jgi:uncharacterized membrane protein (DUF4010 family)
MQIRQIPARWRGRDAGLTARGQAHAAGPGRGEQDGAAWGDERQVAVWGQVSARTLYLVVMLNGAAGFIFNAIDSRRYGPCVTVFFAIALASTAYAGWTARRKGVDVRAPRATGPAQLVVQCLVFGVLLYVLDRLTGWGHTHDSWPDAALKIAGYALGWGIGLRFIAAWRQRQALRSQEAADHHNPGAPDLMP